MVNEAKCLTSDSDLRGYIFILIFVVQYSLHISILEAIMICGWSRGVEAGVC